MSFPAAPTFPRRFKRPVSSTFPTTPTWPPSSVLPTPPVPGPVLWLRGDDAPNSSGGLAVPLWKDVSGNGNDATQAVVASQPTGISNQINGHAAVVFDGVNDFLWSSISRTQPCTIFMVAHCAPGNINQYFIDGATINQAILWNVATDSAFSIFAGVVLQKPFGITSYGVLAGVFNGASSVISTNGVKSTGDCGTGNATGTFIGSSGSPNTNYLNGPIAEILIYPTEFSDSPRQTVQAYLGTKYAIPLGLPQITLFDFSGLSGASFVTGGTALYATLQVHNGPTDTILWFNTGTETQPSLGAFLYEEIGCSPLDSAQDMATAFANAMNASLGGSVIVAVVDGSAGTGSLTAVQITDKQTGPVTSATAGNSGVAVSVTQSGAGNS